MAGKKRLEKTCTNVKLFLLLCIEWDGKNSSNFFGAGFKCRRQQISAICSRADVTRCIPGGFFGSGFPELICAFRTEELKIFRFVQILGAKNPQTPSWDAQNWGALRALSFERGVRLERCLSLASVYSCTDLRFLYKNMLTLLLEKRQSVLRGLDP